MRLASSVSMIDNYSTLVSEMKILIVDDSENIRSSLSKIFSFNYPEVVISEAGIISDTLLILQNNSPDIIILDIKLPDGSGIDILKYVRSNSLPCVVIMLTNYSAKQYREICKEEGADYFFDKTTEFDKVLDIFDKLYCSKKDK